MHDFDRLTEEVARFVAAREWAPFHTPRNTAVCLSVEASELLELYLWVIDGQPRPGTEPPPRARVEEEVGDVLISLLNFCAVTGVDPVDAARRKLTALADKYPIALARGSARKDPTRAE